MMKKRISATLLFLFASLLLLSGCGGGGGDEGQVTPVPDPEPLVPVVGFDLALSAFLQQAVETTPATDFRYLEGSLILTGILAATNRETGNTEEFEWAVSLDGPTLAVESLETIVLVPGIYDFALLVSLGAQSYAATIPGEVIQEGANLVSMTLRPVIGDVVTTVASLGGLAALGFQIDAAELTGFSDPRIGIIVDAQEEQVFTLDPLTGLAQGMLINLAAGEHTIRLKFYEGIEQRGQSLPGQELVVIDPTQDQTLIFEMVPPVVETISLTEEGGLATFRFLIPPEVVDEVEGIGNLQVLFQIVGRPENGLHEAILSLTPSGEKYFAEVVFEGFQFGEVTMGLTFVDLSGGGELVAICLQENILVTLDRTPKTTLCQLRLFRRALIGGNLMATLAVNVADVAFNPVRGAVVRANGKVMGITGSGSFGTPGYLKIFLKAGQYTVGAEDADLTGQEDVSLDPLAVENLQIVIAP